MRIEQRLFRDHHILLSDNDRLLQGHAAAQWPDLGILLRSGHTKSNRVHSRAGLLVLVLLHVSFECLVLSNLKLLRRDRSLQQWRRSNDDDVLCRTQDYRCRKHNASGLLCGGHDRIVFIVKCDVRIQHSSSIIQHTVDIEQPIGQPVLGQFDREHIFT